MADNTSNSLADSLDPDRIVETIDRLGERIDNRFPGSGLSQICERLLQVARDAKFRAQCLARPLHALRIGLMLVIVGLVVGVAAVTMVIDMRTKGVNIPEFLQVLEAGLNDLVLIGAGLFFVFTLEIRIKRRRALTAIHQLRSIAHIIDMHQLTKDPERVLSRVAPDRGEDDELSTVELGRYLDYCSEMLSLTGKIAAIYVQNLNDAVVLASVNEIENLTTGLSRKIWQKIMILHSAGANG